MLKKYKVHLISGVLLSITILLSLNNFGTSKINIAKEEKLQVVSEPNILERSDYEKNKNIKIQEDEEKSTYKNEKNINDVENSTNNIFTNESTIQNNNQVKIKENTKPIQTKSTQTKATVNTSPNITGEKYTVKKGDTLFLIAERANISVDYLKEINNLYSDIIYENQILQIKTSLNNKASNRGNERSEDLYWLSRIIHSEAQGESYMGKVAVGNIIMNRVNSRLFPNTIKEVIFDKQDGYIQFSPVLDGTIYNTPDAESIKAAKEVLSGARPVGDALYFLNPRKSTNFWIVNNRKYMTTIGLHDFYY